MKPIAVTNNSLVYETMRGKRIFGEIMYNGLLSRNDILKTCENLIGNGHTLLMHPFLGNLPVYETPYKTVILSERREVVDFRSLSIINSALRISRAADEERTRAFWGESDLDCFMNGDLIIVERWLVKIYLPGLRKTRRVHNGNA